jgi:hypothetical protein
MRSGADRQMNAPGMQALSDTDLDALAEFLGSNLNPGALYKKCCGAI